MLRLVSGVLGLLLVVMGPMPSSAVPSAAVGKGVRVEEAWARGSIGTSRPAAAYVTVVNSGSKATILTAVSSPAAERAAVHNTISDGSTMTMAPVGPIEIPAGGRIDMKPGGFHIMLMDLKQALRQGESIEVHLHFADGSDVDASAQVMGPGSMGPAN